MELKDSFLKVGIKSKLKEKYKHPYECFSNRSVAYRNNYNIRSIDPLLIIPTQEIVKSKVLSKRFTLSFEVVHRLRNRPEKRKKLVSGSVWKLSSRACHPLAGARVETYDHELASYARCPCRE